MIWHELVLQELVPPRSHWQDRGMASAGRKGCLEGLGPGFHFLYIDDNQ